MWAIDAGSTIQSVIARDRKRGDGPPGDAQHSSAAVNRTRCTAVVVDIHHDHRVGEVARERPH